MTFEDAWKVAGPRSVLSPQKAARLFRVAVEVSALDGDMAELGVYRGGSAYLLHHAAPHKRLLAFDSFAGMERDDIPGGAHNRGDFRANLEDVSRFLRGEEIEIHQGWFPETAAALEGRTFCLVHLDADQYRSTLDGLQAFWPRIVGGGALVLDDVHWNRCPGVDRACREYFGADVFDRMAVQHGQGVVIKATEPR